MAKEPEPPQVRISAFVPTVDPSDDRAPLFPRARRHNPRRELPLDSKSTYAPPHHVTQYQGSSRDQVEGSRDDVDRGPHAPPSHLNPVQDRAPPASIREGFGVGDPATGIALGDPERGFAIGQPPLSTDQQLFDTMDADAHSAARSESYDAGGFDSDAFDGAFNTAPLNAQMLNGGPGVTDWIPRDEPPIALGDTTPPIRLEPRPSAGTSPLFHGGRPPAPHPSLVVDQPVIVKSPLVIREGESLFVTESDGPVLRAKAHERVGSPPQKEIALIQLRGLIEACDEAVNFDRTHNVRLPYLWLDDKQYLSELRDILHELRRLNKFLEASSGTEPAVLKSADKVTSRFTKFFEAYQSEMGKGVAQLTKGVIALGLLYAGVEAGVTDKLLGK
jgi:hypothetical protein